MTREECAKLAIYVGELCPQQRIGKATGLVWHDIIGHLDYDECRRSAAMVASRQPFVAPSEIIAEIAAARSARQPHSEACRRGDHGDQCRVSWCGCTCHPAAVAAVASPGPSRLGIQGTRRDREPRQLGPGDIPGRA